MNKINFNQTGGFPLSTNILDEIQTAYQVINGVGAMAGNLAILSGCEIVGTTVAAGTVQIDGETLPFKTGTIQVSVVIVEEKTMGEFENGVVKEIVMHRYARFGSGVKNYVWKDFKRVFPLGGIAGAMKEIQDEITLLKAVVAPIFQGDGIQLFDNIAALVPAGYDEVEESEWRGRMAVHLDKSDTNMDVVGKMGGSKTHTQTVEEMPAHDHGVAEYAGGVNKGGPHLAAPVNSQITSDRTTTTGGGKAMDIMNPYRVVLFIKWVGIGNGMNDKK